LENEISILESVVTIMSITIMIKLFYIFIVEIF